MLPNSLPAYNDVFYLDTIYGDGVVNSTTGDLFRWSRALRNNTILSATSQNLMTKQWALTDTVKKWYYGFGVFTGISNEGKFISHSGSWPGYKTNITSYPDADLTIRLVLMPEP